ncbi:MAG TPA: MarR family transcriptional regulator [Microscillaceae bacterium]|nr:MarR family transcriptional regulator [Microscillaceae bacterium]
MNYTFLQQILAYLETFENQHPDQATHTVLRFSTWLSGQFSVVPTEKQALPMPVVTESETVESRISALLIFLNRYAKVYIKKALEDSALLNGDDFTYLVSLLRREGISKIELIEANLQEKTSGMEVIKRLVARGFLEQRTDPTDKRSKQLFLTSAGRAALFSTFEKMTQVSQLVSGNLSQSEKLVLLQLLQKLDDFHNPLFKQARDHDFEHLWESLQEELHFER